MVNKKSLAAVFCSAPGAVLSVFYIANFWRTFDFLNRHGLLAIAVVVLGVVQFFAIRFAAIGARETAERGEAKWLGFGAVGLALVTTLLGVGPLVAYSVISLAISAIASWFVATVHP